MCVGVVPAQHDAAVLEVATPTGTVSVRCEVLWATLCDADGQPTARMCGFAYLGEDPRRPVTFFWNGGPGFCSAMLHTGFAAPRIADFAGGTGVIDNPHTLVDCTDLVYVDPVGTGFSRAVAPTSERDFFGITEDARAAAKFVAEVLAAKGWTGRPIVLCGESYGGIRVAAMLEPLRGLGIVPAGLILISPALELRTLRPASPEDRANAAADVVPTLTALALADGLREAVDPRARIEDACRVALGPMLAAMRAGDDPEDPEDEQVAAALDRLTGGRTFRTMYRRDGHDARLRLRPLHMGGVSLTACDRAIRTVLTDTFAIAEADDYERSMRGLGMNWRGENGEPYAFSDARATRMLAAACRDGHRPRVFVAGGWFDAVVPFGVARRLAAERAFGACELELHDYPAGHMIYVDVAAHAELAGDLRRWLEQTRR